MPRCLVERGSQGVLFLLLLASTSRAWSLDQPVDPPEVSVWSVVPANATTRDFINVRNAFTGCDDGIGWDASVDLATNTITLVTEPSDICDAVHGKVTDTPVGYLPSGQYTVKFVACHPEFDPPTCSPSLAPALSFGVADAGRRPVTVPAISRAGVIALAGLLACLGVAVLQRKLRAPGCRS